MKKLVGVAARVSIVAWLASAAALLMAARPGNEFQLQTQLFGQPVRWTMPDGGRSGVFTAVSDGGLLNGTGCMPLYGAKTPTNLPLLPDGGLVPKDDGGAPDPVFNLISANVLLVVPLVGVNVCIRPSANSPTWDGGCNATPTSENYGVPLPVGTPQYIVPDSNATSLCAVSDAGTVALPVWTVQ